MRFSDVSTLLVHPKILSFLHCFLKYSQDWPAESDPDLKACRISCKICKKFIKILSQHSIYLSFNRSFHMFQNAVLIKYKLNANSVNSTWRYLSSSYKWLLSGAAMFLRYEEIWWLELETKAIPRFAKVIIVSYSRPSFMIIASASQFHVYLL